MNYSETTNSANPPRRSPGNKGKLIGPKPPLRLSHVWSIRAKLQIERRVRDLALFNLAIDSKLRGCDIVAVRVDDVVPNGYTVDRATIRQRKTGRPVRFELTEQTRQSLDEYLRLTARKAGDFLFGGRGNSRRGLTTRQYARLVSTWISSIGLDPPKFGTRSLRRTKATLIYRRTGNLRAVQLLLGHTKIESTVRYLGIEIDDAIEIPEAERHGAGDVASGKLQHSEAPEGQHAIKAYDRRGADYQGRCAAARLTLQRLHEFCGAGSGDPCACGEFPLRTLADCGRRGDNC